MAVMRRCPLFADRPVEVNPTLSIGKFFQKNSSRLEKALCPVLMVRMLISPEKKKTPRKGVLV
ncbi:MULTISPECIES: hypothetical protein [Paenibacillus]|uniref:hypothetical protein n=1 Tax=Paenibacillus TaxID=44249 RepID=UPI0013573B16|nr:MULTISPECIES: hypothetical protein [Paenibacillus]